MAQKWECLDGNEAAARIAYQLSEVISIYPITPASPMAEHTDDWAAAGQAQHVGHRARRRRDAVRGRCRRRAARRTAEGCPRHHLHGIAGPAPDDPQHVQDRRRADPLGHPRLGAHRRHPRALDLRRPQRRDVGPLLRLGHARGRLGAGGPGPGARGARGHAALAHPVPALLRWLPDLARGRQDRHARAGATCARSCARRTCSPSAPAACRPRTRSCAARPRTRTSSSRRARPPTPTRMPSRASSPRSWPSSPSAPAASIDLVTYTGAPDAERVILVMGSGTGAVKETVEVMTDAGEKVGMVQVRLFQPFPSEELVAALPKTVKSIAVLDRTKEPGAVGEPFYLETVAALNEAMDSADAPFARMPRVIGGRYGLSLQGVHAADGQAHLRRAGARTRPRSTSPSASSTTSPTSACPSTASSCGRGPRARSRPCSSASAPTAPSAPTRPRSRSSARAPTSTRRATSSTTPRSRAR